jgi:hypothetical protein
MRCARVTRRALGLSLVLAAAAAREARADEQTETPGPPRGLEGDKESLPLAPEAVAPPPINNSYIQYGVAFTAEFVATAGPMCDVGEGGASFGQSAASESSVGLQPCILGSGGGLAARVGYRSAGPWYIGGAYEVSKQDPNKIYRLALLQQLRVEARYYLYRGLDTQPFLGAAAGAAGYGNEWGVQAYGPSASVSIGAETQISRRTVVSAGLTYRAIAFLDRFTDPSRTERAPGLAHFVGLELALEARDPL